MNLAYCADLGYKSFSCIRTYPFCLTTIQKSTARVQTALAIMPAILAFYYYYQGSWNYKKIKGIYIQKRNKADRITLVEGCKQSRATNG